MSATVVRALLNPVLCVTTLSLSISTMVRINVRHVVRDIAESRAGLDISLLCQSASKSPILLSISPDGGTRRIVAEDCC